MESDLNKTKTSTPNLHSYPWTQVFGLTLINLGHMPACNWSWDGTSHFRLKLDVQLHGDRVLLETH